MNLETFLQELRSARARGDQLQQRAEAAELEVSAAEALAELQTVLEELRVTEEEIRVQNEQLTDLRKTTEAELQRWHYLFQHAPIAYLSTDPLGVIREVNRRALVLLRTPQSFLVGHPLVSYVDDRWAFRNRLRQLGDGDGAEWTMRLRPRGGGSVEVLVVASPVRDPDGAVTHLRWAFNPVAAARPAAGEPPALAEGSSTEPVGPPPKAPLVDAVVPTPDWDNLAHALHETVQAAMPILRVDGAGLMLADEDGRLRWVTATNDAEQAFERAERDLGEGPCVQAFRSGQIVATDDVFADPRWPRLAPAARSNRIRGVLAAPILAEGRPVGTCNALAFSPREWTEGDLGAAAAFAGMAGRLLGAITDARHKAGLAAQLQVALDSRIVIEQAKGMLMAGKGLDAQAAFEQLRRRARSSGRRLADVAAEVVANPDFIGGRPPNRRPGQGPPR